MDVKSIRNWPKRYISPNGLLTLRDREKAHYATTVRGGLLGGFGGLAAGLGATVYSHKRFPGFRSMGIPFKVFLGTARSLLDVRFLEELEKAWERDIADVGARERMSIANRSQ